MLKSNIAHLTTVHIRTDTRVLYKEVQTLSRVYNTTLIVADGMGDVTNSFAEIVDLGKPKNRFSRFLFYGLKALPILRRKKISCVHIHDPELLLVAFILKLRGYKIIYDIHELVYEDIKTKNWISSQFIKNVIAWFYKYMEGMALKYFDGVILAENGYKEYYEKHYPKRIYKVKYIRNYPIKAMFNIVEKSNKTTTENENAIIYLGAISEDRGIVELVDAMNFLDETFKLYVIGRWTDSSLLERCQSLSGWSKVEKLGYLRPDEIGKYIQMSKIGMCTLHRLENFAYTTPVKSFEYLINGLPLIMTDFPFWKDFYKGTAVFIDPQKPQEISEAIVKLVHNEKMYQEMSSEGIKLALQHCWENEEKELLDLYTKII